jgi:hypothetical protein
MTPLHSYQAIRIAFPKLAGELLLSALRVTSVTQANMRIHISQPILQTQATKCHSLHQQLFTN